MEAQEVEIVNLDIQELQKRAKTLRRAFKAKKSLMMSLLSNDSAGVQPFAPIESEQRSSRLSSTVQQNHLVDEASAGDIEIEGKDRDVNAICEAVNGISGIDLSQDQEKLKGNDVSIDATDN